MASESTRVERFNVAYKLSKDAYAAYVEQGGDLLYDQWLDESWVIDNGFSEFLEIFFCPEMEG
jgi:hypothetical protein